MPRNTGPQMPKVSAATLAKEGRQVPGTDVDAQYGNTVYEWRGDHFIVGPGGQVLGWAPIAARSAGGQAGGLLPTPRGLLDY